MEFEETVEFVGQAVELTGIAVIVIGLLFALVTFVGRTLTLRGAGEAYGTARESIGRSILLGLELLVAGDIIRTVAVSPSLTSVGVLAGVVLIRTFLSFTLEMEISGRWPWEHRRDESSLPQEASASPNRPRPA